MENWRDRSNRTSSIESFDFKKDFNVVKPTGFKAFVYNIKVRQTLWKKETNDAESLYIDPFADVQVDFANEVSEWIIELERLKSHETSRDSQKSNKISDQFLEYGHESFRERNWYQALCFYNRALCFAETGTLYEGLSYGNRALCFYHMEMYRRAVIDFGLAAQKKCPEQFLSTIKNLQTQCRKLAKKEFGAKAHAMKLSFPADKKLPSMASCLEIKRNKDFGRHIVAKRDIDVGQTVFFAETFASAVKSGHQVYCLTCQKTEMNFMPCKNCSDVMFCNADCANWDSLHRHECTTPYHHISDLSVKFIIQTILVAIEMFESIESLMEFVEEVTSDSGYDKIPKTSCDSLSKYGIFLRLTQSFKDDRLFCAYQAFSCLWLIPNIKYLFDTEHKLRFLMQLVLHHATVIPKNAFLDQFNNHSTEYIFDVLSIINHSCAPNLHFVISGKIGYCITVRPIKKGDQVFVNYLGVINVNLAKVPRVMWLK